jgi:hypothetical protein
MEYDSFFSIKTKKVKEGATTAHQIHDQFLIEYIPPGTTLNMPYPDIFSRQNANRADLEAWKTILNDLDFFADNWNTHFSRGNHSKNVSRFLVSQPTLS